MPFRHLQLILCLAFVACSAQTARQPASEPVGKTTITRAALTIERPEPPPRTSTGNVTVRRAAVEAPDRVAPQTALEPAYREALAANPALRGVEWGHLLIEREGGHVTLRGLVRTVADKVQVELAVRQVKGVTSVSNRLETSVR
jgi:hypothetical protein